MSEVTTNTESPSPGWAGGSLDERGRDMAKGKGGKGKGKPAGMGSKMPKMKGKGAY